MPADQPEVQARPGNALLWAIFEMREAMTRHIEEYRSLLLSREGSGEFVETTVATSSPSSLTRAEPPAAAPGPLKSPPPVVTVGALPATGRPDDPRQRLDALARLLDKRARQSSTPSPAGEGADRPGDP